MRAIRGVPARPLAAALSLIALSVINTSVPSSWAQYRNEATPEIATKWDFSAGIPVSELDQLAAYGTTGVPGHEALYR